MNDYTIALRAMSQGRGKFTFAFARYEEVPGNVAQKIIAEAAKDAELGTRQRNFLKKVSLEPSKTLKKLLAKFLKLLF
jgi:hypothetical protein